MSKKELTLPSDDVLKFNLFLSNGQTVLITSCNKDGSIRGIAPISWFMPTSHNPDLFMVSIGNGPPESGLLAYRYSYTLIKETMEFGVNVAMPELGEAIAKAGTTHANEVDKFKETGLTPMPGKRISAPMIEECYLNIECKVVQELATGDHTIFIGEPLAILYDEDVFIDGKFQGKYRKKENQVLLLDLFSEMF